jgi:peptidoglycan/LPS O-acetylase OafA/YrhL
MMRICKFSGRLSYPLYITHISFVYVLANFAAARHPGKSVVLTWIFLVVLFAITVAWLALKYWDEPIRARLTRRFGIRRATA